MNCLSEGEKLKKNLTPSSHDSFGSSLMDRSLNSQVILPKGMLQKHQILKYKEILAVQQ